MYEWKINYTCGKWKMLINHGHQTPLLSFVIISHSGVFIRSHSRPNLIPNFPCLEMNGFEHLWTTIILSSKGKLESEAQPPSQMHDVLFVFNMEILDHTFSIVSRVLLCNISTYGNIVETRSIKSHNIVSIFEDHKCNVSNNFISIMHIKKIHQ